MTTTIRRTITAVLATCLLLVGFAASATAEPGSFERQEHKEGLFYGDFDQQVSLFVGATPQQFCTGDEPSAPARVFHRHDGSVHVKVDAVRYPTYLYSSPLAPPDLIGATCAAMFDSDPDTVPLQPFAVGEGLVRMRIEIAPDGTVGVVNSTVGSATSTDGRRWQLRGWADLAIVGGVPVGSPAEFQGLTIHQTVG